ncbi:MAG: hypothetical protein ABWZ25_17730 [Chitinophagaceae bacterium]
MKLIDETSSSIWPLRFLRWFCREEFIEEIEGDLTEIYFLNYQQ